MSTESYAATIAVAEIRPPNGNRKSYTLITSEGNELSLWPNKINLIRTGQRYQVLIKDNEVNGRIFHNIEGTPHCLGPHQPEQEIKPPQPQPRTNGKAKMDYWTPKPRDPAELR